MTQSLEDMVLIVTGAANGIGRAIAEHAIERGVRRLVLTDVLDGALSDIAHGLGSVADIALIVADLSTPQEVKRIAVQAVSRFGRVDGLVNAAGITTRASFLTGDAEIWDQVFAINTRAPYLLMQSVIADMIDRKEPGSIVNIQSMNAHCGHPDLAIYASSKGALQTLTKNAANAHLADSIRVNGLNLGWTLTNSEHHMQATVLDQGEDWAERIGATLPLGRLLVPQDAARLAVHLLDPASSPLTGACIDLEQWIAGAPP